MLMKHKYYLLSSVREIYADTIAPDYGISIVQSSERRHRAKPLKLVD